MEKYVALAIGTLKKVSTEVCTFSSVTNARLLFDKVDKDLRAADKLGDQAAKMSEVKNALASARQNAVRNYAACASRNLRAQLKFPVLLDAPETVDEGDLKAIRQALGGLAAELADPVWTAFPGSEEILAPLRTFANACTHLVNTLMTGDAMSEVSLQFTPLGDASNDPNPFKGQLRYVRVFANRTGKFDKDLDLSQRSKGDDPLLIKLPVNSGLKLEFYSDVDRATKTATMEVMDWALPRLIQEGRAERVEGRPTDWKLKLTVPVNGSSQTLEAFSIRLNSNNPLPRKEDWPKK